MVVGATGAIGSVCSRLLAMVARGHMVSPETANCSPSRVDPEGDRRELVLSSRADKDIADMDMIVTATSGAGKKILDIMNVKPGLRDHRRGSPARLPPEEVAKRPDVLVIESARSCLPARCR